MEILTEGGIFPISPERRVEPIAKSNVIRKPWDEYDQSDARPRHQQKQPGAGDTFEISEEYRKLKEAQDEKWNW